MKSSPGWWKLAQIICHNLRAVTYSPIFFVVHGRRKVRDFFLLLHCKSLIWCTEKHFFKIIIYFFTTSKYAANYVISFEVYDFKILKLCRQECWPFSPGWAAHITSTCLWSFPLPRCGRQLTIEMQLHKLFVKDVGELLFSFSFLFW